MVVEDGVDEGVHRPAHSKAERVYVNGASIDEPLFVASDGDLDGYIAADMAELPNGPKCAQRMEPISSCAGTPN